MVSLKSPDLSEALSRDLRVPNGMLYCLGSTLRGLDPIRPPHQYFDPNALGIFGVIWKTVAAMNHLRKSRLRLRANVTNMSNVSQATFLSTTRNSRPSARSVDFARASRRVRAYPRRSLRIKRTYIPGLVFQPRTPFSPNHVTDGRHSTPY